jgi:hypothetical protein
MTFFIVIFIIVFVLAPLANAAAKRLSAPPSPGALPDDVARLREELDQLTAQVSRLQEEQGFMLRLLTEGEKRRPPLASGDSGAARTREGVKDRTEPQTPDGGM